MDRRKIRSERFLRQRKFFMVLPLLILPFVTLIFWALGGGKAAGSPSNEQQQTLNVDLPDPLLENKGLDKLSYYRLAKMDSSRRRKQIKNDPYYAGNASALLPDVAEVDKKDSLSSDKQRGGILYRDKYQNPNVTRIYKKLGQLDSLLDKPVIVPEAPQVDSMAFTGNSTMVSASDIDRLEHMMRTMGQPTGKDPEMRQLNDMLEKIIAIQHPERTAERLKSRSRAKRGQVFVVVAQKDQVPVSVLGTGFHKGQDVKIENHFYSLDGPGNADRQPNAIRAVVHETQELINGSTVKLRLKDDIYINGVLIPKGHFVFGKASLAGERLHIEIKSIRYKRSLFPVSLAVYDLDGMKGIYVPGALTRKVAKRSAGSAIQGLGLTALNPSLSAQAAGAGIATVKDLIHQKIKLVKVTVKAGYEVLLKNKRQ